MTDAPSPDRGHRTRDHTADVIVEAWGPTRGACLEEAVLGLVRSFADVAGGVPTRRLPLALDAEPDEEVLVDLLDEVVYRLDATAEVPAAIGLHDEPGGGVTGWVDVVAAGDVEVTGALPKGVSRSGLRLADEDGSWRCRVEVDV